MRSIRKTECETMTLLMRLCTNVGNPSGWALLSVGIMIYEGSVQGWGLKLGLVSLLAGILAKSVKHLFRRERPCLHQSFPKALARIPDPWSFPSGHTTSAFAVAVFCLVAGAPAAPLFALLASGIAASRIYLGVHFPSDVLAGACLGAMVGVSVYPLLSLMA